MTIAQQTAQNQAMRSAKITLVALAALMLAGCAAPSTEQEGSISAEPTPQPATADTAGARDRCAPGNGPIQMNDPIAGDSLSARAFAHMRDLGPRDFAKGEATLNEEGRPATYTVAPGDVASAVAARFCITEMELDLLNAVRICGYGIHPDDVYNLDPYTVASIGGRASGVCDNEITFTLP